MHLTTRNRYLSHLSLPRTQFFSVDCYSTNYQLLNRASLVTSESCLELENHIQRLKQTTIELFKNLDDENRFTLKPYSMHFVVEDVFQFEYIFFSDESPFVHLNYTIKQFIRHTSNRKGTVMNESVNGRKYSVS